MQRRTPFFYDRQTAPGRSTRRVERAGFTLIEVMIGLVVLVVAVLGTMGSLTSSTVLSESNRERAIAMHAARQMMEQLQAEDFWDVFVLYNQDDADDPGGAAPGANFAVEGISVQSTDADGFAGRVLFPASGADGGNLFETLNDASWGMPRDLDGLNGIDAADHATDYKILPVRVRVEWGGVSGDRVIELESLLCLRRD